MKTNKNSKVVTLEEFVREGTVLMTSRINYREIDADDCGWFDNVLMTRATLDERIECICNRQLSENIYGDELVEDIADNRGWKPNGQLKMIDLVDVIYSNEIIDDLLQTYDCIGGEGVVAFIKKVQSVACNTAFRQETIDKMLMGYRDELYVLTSGYSRLAALYNLYKNEREPARGCELVDIEIPFEVVNFKNTLQDMFPSLTFTGDLLKNEEVLEELSTVTTLLFILQAFGDNAKNSCVGDMDDGLRVMQTIRSLLKQVSAMNICEDFRLERLGKDAIRGFETI